MVRCQYKFRTGSQCPANAHYETILKDGGRAYYCGRHLGSRHTWIKGKFFILGAIVNKYRQALRVKKLLEKDNIKVYVKKVQPAPVWEIWAHDLDKDVKLEANTLMVKAKRGKKVDG